MDILSEIAFKYGTDKCPQIKHVYTPYYFKIFNEKRNKIKKVVEMGIGTSHSMKHSPHYIVGASLFMWRDFFPNAKIYGADIEKESMINEKRIKTIVCNEFKKADLLKLVKFTGKDIDLFVDDGWHTTEAQIFMCKTLMPLFNKGITYIVEDVSNPRAIYNALKKYDCEWPHLPGRKHYKGRLFVVKK